MGRQSWAKPYPAGFFLDGAKAPLYAIYYPAADHATGDVLLYVAPFAGEMANSRDVIAGLAREAAKQGTSVLVVDLFGCGDSGGEFCDARWEIWLDDLEAACCWLEDHTNAVIGLWGLRLGALLGMDFARRSGRSFSRYLLWQPVIEGGQMLTQFIRMNVLPQDLGPALRGRIASPELRSQLQPGLCLPVAGYEIASELIAEIDQKELAPPRDNGVPVHWLELVQAEDAGMSPVTQRTVENFKSSRISFHWHQAVGWPFWLFPYCMEYKDLLDNFFGMLPSSAHDSQRHSIESH